MCANTYIGKASGCGDAAQTIDLAVGCFVSTNVTCSQSANRVGTLLSSDVQQNPQL